MTRTRCTPRTRPTRSIRPSSIPPIALAILLALAYITYGSTAVATETTADAASSPCDDNDTDGDGIPNDYELDGYYYDPSDPSSSCAGILPCNGASSVTDDNKKTWSCFVTNPQAWSTDEDPFGDYTEATGNNLPPSLVAPYDSPLVAAMPIVSVSLESFTVAPNEEITDSNGGSHTASATHTTTNTNQLGASATVGISVTEGLNASVTGSYSYTWSTSDATTTSDTSEWSTATTTNPSEAATLHLDAWFENLGPVSASNVTPTFNVTLNGETLATLTLETSIEDLGVEGSDTSRYPASGSVTVTDDDGITLTLDQYQALQSGASLGLAVTQVDGDVSRWDDSTDSFSGTGMSGWQSEIAAANVRLTVYDTNLKSYLFFVTANPSGDGETFLTVQQVLEEAGVFVSETSPGTLEAYDSDVPDEQTLTSDNWYLGMSDDLLDALDLPDEDAMTQDQIDQFLALPVKDSDAGSGASQLELMSTYDAVHDRARLPAIASIVYTAYQVDCSVDDSVYEDPSDYDAWADFRGQPVVIFDPSVEQPSAVSSVAYKRVVGSYESYGAILALATADPTELTDGGGGLWGWTEGGLTPDAWAWASECDDGNSCDGAGCGDTGDMKAVYYSTGDDVSLPCAEGTLGSAWVEVYLDGAEDPVCYSYLDCGFVHDQSGCDIGDGYAPHWPWFDTCEGSNVPDNTNQTSATAPGGLEVTGQSSSVPPANLPLCTLAVE